MTQKYISSSMLDYPLVEEKVFGEIEKGKNISIGMLRDEMDKDIVKMLEEIALPSILKNK